MKKLFFVVLISIFTTPLFAQNNGQAPQCTTPTTSSNFTLMEGVRIADYSGYEFYLKIYVHVLSHSETGPGQSVLGINEALKRLYDNFDNIGIHFVWDGEIDYIYNDSWHDNPNNYAVNILNSFNHNDGVDIYLGNSQVPAPVGRANGIGEISSLVVAGFEGVAAEDNFIFWPQSSTITHEMGHVLFLWHTFHGTSESESDPNTCAECFESTDPDTSSWYCGDYVFDTPPDPNFLLNFNNNCEYIGDGQDVCNNDFDPLTNNFMSYAPNGCRDGFTHGQIRRMKNAIAILPHLQNTQIQNYTYIRGKNLLCHVDINFKVYSNDITNLTIEYSNNITVGIGSPVNNVINLTVTNNDYGANEGSPAWIIAKRNGVEVGRKNFWVGVPQKMIDNTITGPIYVDPNDIKEYYIPARLEGATTHQWIFPGFPPIEQQPYVTSTDGWQYDYLTKYYNVLNTMIGTCEGELFVYGINECGNGVEPDPDTGLDVNVSGVNPQCIVDDIIYYPNPANDLLQIDLSLQDYKVFDIVVYNDSQIAVYTDQSTNVVKTIDTFNLPNDTYYLHIYDGNNLILSKILIIKNLYI